MLVHQMHHQMRCLQRLLPFHKCWQISPSYVLHVLNTFCSFYFGGATSRPTHTHTTNTAIAHAHDVLAFKKGCPHLCFPSRARFCLCTEFQPSGKRPTEILKSAIASINLVETMRPRSLGRNHSHCFYIHKAEANATHMRTNKLASCPTSQI